MTTTHTDPEIIKEEDDAETSKIPPIAQKTSKFGNTGFGNGSKFGKGPSGGSNPQLKQRPGRAAARGR
ncbi:hypothetical protein H7169_00870 [Candidatus Gracilibacteria bacterium]|nr:hypothetical protein [Candidatus Gracilibacteria bacterium]